MVLEFWCRYARPTRCGLGQTALRLGGSRPLPELFQATGCKFELNAKTILPLTKLLREELEKL
jgi:oligoendopeptidase F